MSIGRKPTINTKRAARTDYEAEYHKLFGFMLDIMDDLKVAKAADGYVDLLKAMLGIEKRLSGRTRTAKYYIDKHPADYTSNMTWCDELYYESFLLLLSSLKKVKCIISKAFDGIQHWEIFNLCADAIHTIKKCHQQMERLYLDMTELHLTDNQTPEEVEKEAVIGVYRPRRVP